MDYLKALFWFVTAVIVVFCVICSRDSSGDSSDTILMVSLGGWAPCLLAFVFHCLDKQARLMLYVTACSFIAVSAFAVYFLGLLSLHVLNTGSLGPSGMILAFLPIWYIGLCIGGAIVGLCMYATERLIKKYTQGA